MKRFVCLFFLAVASPGVIKVSHAQERIDTILHQFYHEPKEILVAAHRAAHFKHPENSIAAIREAIRIGADIVELDLRKTGDGVYVLMHDRTIERVTGRPGSVSDYSYAALSEIPLLHEGKATPYKIPTLQEALEAAKGQIMIDLDFKLDSSDLLPVCRIIEEAGMQRQILFFLYDFRHIRLLQGTGASIAAMPRAYSSTDLLEILNHYDVPVIHIDPSFYSDTIAAPIQARGMRLWANALGRFDRLDRQTPDAGYEQMLREMPAVNIIQTDTPERLLNFLRQRGRHQ